MEEAHLSSDVSMGRPNNFEPLSLFTPF